jgi:alcohol dehydrogenase class IV
VIVTAPAAFRFTYEAMPERHHEVAALLNGGPIENAGPDTLPDILRDLMRDIDAPRGIAELGYSEDDVPTLVEGAMKQQRLLVLAPRDVSEQDLTHILNASMTNW